jgi:chromosomal replication initiation ATPase DnaA
MVVKTLLALGNSRKALFALISLIVWALAAHIEALRPYADQLIIALVTIVALFMGATSAEDIGRAIANRPKDPKEALQGALAELAAAVADIQKKLDEPVVIELMGEDDEDDKENDAEQGNAQG